MLSPRNPAMSAGATASTPGAGGLFSNTNPTAPDTTSEAGTGFSALTSGFKAAAGVLGQAIPNWTRNELENQSEDQLFDPTFDRRAARDRVNDVQTTDGSPVGRPLVPGVSNMALLFFGALVVGSVVVARNL